MIRQHKHFSAPARKTVAAIYVPCVLSYASKVAIQSGPSPFTDLMRVETKTLAQGAESGLVGVRLVLQDGDLCGSAIMDTLHLDLRQTF